MKRLITTFLLSTLISSFVIAQVTNITGQVLDESTQEPLVGVTVRVKNTVVGTSTDKNGNFSLDVKLALPFTLDIGSIGFQAQEVAIESGNQNLSIALKPSVSMADEVVVSASRVEEGVLTSPVTIEKLDAKSIRESSAANFWDALNNLKGVDLGTQSIGFKSVNMRGFGANNNTRVVQWVDGMDNRSPSTGFGFGNIVGVSELDVESIEVIPGASSVLYGPDAVNGIMLTTTKSPFDYEGLSVQVKNGVNNVNSSSTSATLLTDYALRYAQKIGNRFAFKVNLAYFNATDWIANDYSDRVNRGRPATFVPGTRETNLLYDGLNLYGDEFTGTARITTGALANTQITRTGYEEKDLLDNQITSLKVGGALHYKITNKIEAIAQINYGKGNTVQTGGQRAYFPFYGRIQAKFELKGDNFYLRAYTTQQSANGYGTIGLATALNNGAASNATWAGDYANAYYGNIGGITAQDHQAARAYADRTRIAIGSAQYNTIKDDITNRPTTLGGIQTIDNSDLWHFEGMYNFKNEIKFLDIVVGAHFRKYFLDSRGTLFPLKDVAEGKDYTVDEYGGYIQIAKTIKVSDNFSFRPTIATRYDKNEYLDGGFTPRFSLLTTFKEHNFRISYQTAFRNPSPGNLFAFNLTSGELGGTTLIAEKANLFANPAYTESSVLAYRQSGNAASLTKYAPQIIKTEKVATIEAGYKTLLFEKLFIDAYYFHSEYSDFIANQNFYQARTGTQSDLLLPASSQFYQINLNKADKIIVDGFGLGIEYNVVGNYKINANYAYQEGRDGPTNKKLSDPEVVAKGRNFFNSPENRFNITFSNSKLTKNLGFSVNWRWQDRTWWEQGFSGDTWIPSFHTIDAQVSYKLPSLKTIVKIGGSNLFNQYYTQGYGLPPVGGLYYISLNFDQLFR